MLVNDTNTHLLVFFSALIKAKFNQECFYDFLAKSSTLVYDSAFFQFPLLPCYLGCIFPFLVKDRGHFLLDPEALMVISA